MKLICLSASNAGHNQTVILINLLLLEIAQTALVQAWWGQTDLCLLLFTQSLTRSSQTEQDSYCTKSDSEWLSS